METLIIIPTYNERENIGEMLERLLALPSRVDVLVVDDGSPDGTAALVRSRMEGEPRVHLLERPRKMGLGSAYRDGFRYALEHGAEYIFEMDADFSHDPAVIPRFLEAAQEVDLVLGSRYLDGKVTVVNWPLDRLILSYSANLYTPDRHRPAAVRRDRRVQVLPAPGARGGAARPGEVRRLRVPDRDELQVLEEGDAGSARSPSCSRTAAPACRR